MLPPPRGRRRKDRLSVSITPPQNLRTDIPSPCLHVLFQGSDHFQRIYGGIPDDAAEVDIQVQDKTMAEVIDFLEQRDRDIYWLSTRTTYEDLPSHAAAPLDPSLICAIQDLPEPEAFTIVVEYIAIQLLASCYTLLPASSADNLPLGQQRTGSRVVTALRLHTLHRLAPAAGHHARINTETSPWPGLYNGLSKEDELVESISRRRRLAVDASSDEGDGTLQGSSANEQANRASQHDGTEDSRTSPASLNLPPWTRLMTKCNPTSSHKRKGRQLSAYDGPGVTGPDSTASEEPYHPAAQLSPRSTSPRMSSPAGKFKIPTDLRPRQARSDNERPTEALTGRMTTTASDGNRYDSSINTSRAYPFQIPEIRRISASTASQASDGIAARAQPRSGSELSVDWKITFNTMERGPSDTNVQPAADGLTTSSVSSPACTGRRRSSYFSTPLPTTQEEASTANSLPGLSEAHRTTGLNEDSCSSDDSRCRKRRNGNRHRSVVGSAAEEAIAFSAGLRRRPTGASI